jgi:hypothetical protein
MVDAVLGASFGPASTVEEPGWLPYIRPKLGAEVELGNVFSSRVCEFCSEDSVKDTGRGGNCIMEVVDSKVSKWASIFGIRALRIRPSTDSDRREE